MRTLKLSLAIATITLSSVFCQAQPGGAHTGRHNHQGSDHPHKHDKGEKIAKELGLNPKQAEQLKAIHEKQRAENKAIQEKMTPLKSQLKVLKEQKKALNEINMKEIKSMLTPEQFIKFNELKDRKKENRKEKRNK
jgi:Spy/CpxP family protein refolding chaperone